MSLLEKLNDDLKAAMREGDQARKLTLRAVKTAVRQEEVSGDHGDVRLLPRGALEEGGRQSGEPKGRAQEEQHENPENPATRGIFEARRHGEPLR